MVKQKFYFLDHVDENTISCTMWLKILFPVYFTFEIWSSNCLVMTCLLTCQHMTPSTAIEGSKTFSFALCQKSLAEQCVRVVHFLGIPHT